MEFDAVKYEIQRLDLLTYRKALVKCNVECSKDYSHKKYLRLINAILNKLSQSKIPTGFKKSVTLIENEMYSIIDGINCGIERSQLNPESFNKVIDLIDARLLDLKKFTDACGDSNEVYKVEQQKHFEDTLKRTSQELQVLKAIGNKPYAILKAPVIAVPDNAFINFEFVSKNFKCTELGGYVVLHDQLVIGVNTKETKQKPEAVLIQCIKNLERKTGNHYIVLLNRGITNHKVGSHALWYWIMECHDAENFRLSFTNLKRKSIIKTIAIRDWGFANACK